MARRQSTKDGVPRKSRSARLPTASVRGEFRFEPSAEDWDRIASGYGIELTPEDKSEIHKLAENYLLFAPFERAAPFAADAIGYLKRLRKAAVGFRTALLSGQQLKTESERDAAFYAGLLIEQRLEELRYSRTASMNDLHATMTAFMAASAGAMKELESPAARFHDEGETWDALVRGLTSWFKSTGRPTGAAKDADKSKKDAPSRFVGFVRELQNTFPADLRRYTASDVALAKGISDARRKRRKTGQ